MNEKIDWNFIEQLKSISDSNEGSLFNNGYANIEGQLDLIDSVLADVKPKAILEIGTHKGFFDYYCLLVLGQGVKIYTCDVATWSATACRLVNKKMATDAVTFMFGSSQSILPSWTPPVPIELAFIDGDHNYAACQADLYNCEKLGITKMLIDDCLEGTQPREVTEMFCKEKGFKMTKKADARDPRGMVFIEKI